MDLKFILNKNKMGLNKSTGNMYKFNTIKGECPHGCTYCYMKKWGKQPTLHLDDNEFKTDIGSNNYIFIGSSCDMFAKDIPLTWVEHTINHIRKFQFNEYFFQSKNPYNMEILELLLPAKAVKGVSVCTTIETNRHYKEIMKDSPKPVQRFLAMSGFENYKKYITMEPIMDFDIEIVEWLQLIKPMQINIGADTGKNNLPEPSKEKILQLIHELEKFTVVHQKSNLKRLLK
jgi:DNA repair photolyase